MRKTTKLAIATAAVTAAAFLIHAGCSPVQWNFVFVEDMGTDPGATPPGTPILVPANALDAGTVTVTRPSLQYTDISDGAEIFLDSLTFSIFTPGGTEPDFSSIDTVSITIEPAVGGSAVEIATYAGPAQPVTQLVLTTQGVPLADYLANDQFYTINIYVDGTGPATDLQFTVEAVFSVSVAL